MRTEAFTFESRGLQLGGDLFLPGGDGPHPVTVASSGFGGVKEILLTAYGTALAAAGVACLAFDYPNFGVSEGTPRQHVDPRAMRRSYRDAVAAVAAHPALDAGRIGVWGPSLAGGFALATAARVPAVRSALGIVPFIRLPMDRPDLALATEVTKDVVGRALRRPPRMVPVAGPPGSLAAMNTDGAQEWMTAMAREAPAFRNEVTTASLLNMALLSNRKAVAQVRVPVRVILADADTITPAAMVRKALRTVPRLDVVSFPETHFELLTVHDAAVRASVVEWFSRTL